MKNIKNFLFSLSIQLGNYVFPLFTIPIVSRIFGPELLGIFNYYLSIVTILSIFVQYGFEYTGIRQIANEDKKNEYFYNVLFAKFMIFLVVYLIFIIYFFIFERANFQIVIPFSLVLCSALIDFNWIFQYLGKFKILSIISFSSKFISLILILTFIKSKSDFILYVYSLFLPSLIAGLISLFILFNEYSFKRFAFCFRASFTHLKIGFLFFCSKVVSLIYTTFGIVMLGYLSSAFQVGVYSAAMKIITLAITISTLPLTSIIFPKISKRFSLGAEEGKVFFSQCLPVFNFFFIFSFIGLVIFGKIFILGFFGQSFTASVDIFYVLILGFFSVYWGIILGGQLILPLGYDAEFLKIQLYISLLSVLLNIMFIHKYGAFFLAINWSFSELLILIFQIKLILSNGMNINFKKNLFNFKAIKSFF